VRPIPGRGLLVTSAPLYSLNLTATGNQKKGEAMITNEIRDMAAMTFVAC
jgi:hypothetical protein